MIEEATSAFFTAKHDKALRIATVLKFVAWIAVFYTLLRSVLWYLQIDAWYAGWYMTHGYDTTVNCLFDALNQDRTYAVKAFIGLASILLRGLAYWFVLRGAAVGLSILVETDLNYRDMPDEEASDE